MRHYTIKMMSGFSTFKCVLCKHSVTTREFSSQNGNCRSQAAKAMNEHATAAHGGLNPMSPRKYADVARPTTPFARSIERQSGMTPKTYYTGGRSQSLSGTRSTLLFESRFPAYVAPRT